ncbi:response regulator [Clostridium botulinum]|uniref:Uncharacterized protein n=1 Tax=Clostridium botulinum TaxID=1491 RepID=A0A1L7JN55_CLOBO|nr:response regulator [Clostridium botulinum]APU87114.1 hypothetical protein NPD8_4219 [Clostridium botulinum]
MKIRILETETTKKDEIIRTLIGSTWNTEKVYNDHVIIDCCGGLKLTKGEIQIL